MLLDAERITSYRVSGTSAAHRFVGAQWTAHVFCSSWIGSLVEFDKLPQESTQFLGTG